MLPIPPRRPEGLISAENLSLRIGDTPILTPLSFDVRRGDFVSFIGPSGCGKTTLLTIIAGMREGCAGKISVDTRRISFVFQGDSLLEWQTVMGNVLLPFSLKSESPVPGVRERALTILSQVGLSGYEDFFPHQLSGGMKKRVEIARALVTEPELLILDEPFSSLDIITRERLNLLIKKIHRLRRTTIVLVTHSVEEACFLSGKIFVLSPKPAKIMDIKELPENASPLYILSPEQQAVNNAIRGDVKNLWETDGEPPSPAPAWRAPGTASGFWSRHRHNLLVPLEIAGLYFLLSVLKKAFDIPEIIFPAPRAILGVFWETLRNGTIFPDLEITVFESLGGFFIAFILSMILGFVIARFRLVSRLIMPGLIGANTIPTVALAPFLVLWLGFGILPRLVTAVILIFFPLLISVISAFVYSAERVRGLVLFYRPSRIRSLFAMEFPAALPGIFNGVKISITLSVIGAVVGEFVSGHEGLGALVNRAKATFEVELMFTGLIWLIGLGLGYYALASACYYCIRRRLTTPRQKRKKGSHEK
jgi:NitT/TauT family transport system ATP-binding protein